MLCKLYPFLVKNPVFRAKFLVLWTKREWNFEQLGGTIRRAGQGVLADAKPAQFIDFVTQRPVHRFIVKPIHLKGFDYA